jgi:hypothetical protein
MQLYQNIAIKLSIEKRFWCRPYHATSMTLAYPGATSVQVRQAMANHVLDAGELIGRYGHQSR